MPRVSTRGRYDLSTGRPTGRRGYFLRPARAFEAMRGAREVAVMVHGLRNDPRAAAEKFEIARRRLRRLGYRHPVVGFSYDSNARGAHTAAGAARALRVGRAIARANGAHLARFVADFGASSPGTRVRLLGHSLGSEVILAAAAALARSRAGAGAVESVHLFGASAPAGALRPGACGRALARAVRGRVVNYYAPSDGVLAAAGGAPLGLLGAAGAAHPRYAQRRVRPASHRFRSYAAALRSFP